MKAFEIVSIYSKHLNASEYLFTSTLGIQILFQPIFKLNFLIHDTPVVYFNQSICKVLNGIIRYHPALLSQIKLQNLNTQSICVTKLYLHGKTSSSIMQSYVL